MARPPIVISNGGMAEALADGLKPEDTNDTRKPYEIILENVNKMNIPGAGNNGLGSPVAKTLSGRNRDNDPRIYWRFENEDEYQKTNPGSQVKELGLEAQ